MIRVLIVHRKPIFRRGLRMLLEQVAGFEVVIEGVEWGALEVLLQSQRPDVVLLDGSIDGALELTTLVRSQRCSVFVGFSGKSGESSLPTNSRANGES